MKHRNIITLVLMLLNLTLLGQDILRFDVAIIQKGVKHAIADNKITLHPAEFEFELRLPAYMLTFDGGQYSSICYIATTSKSFSDTMYQRKCFNCGSQISPYAFDNHNLAQSMVIGTEGYSFWTISKDIDEHNVSSYKVEGDEIIARVKISEFYIDEEGQVVPVKKYKGKIYLVFEATNRDSSAVGKRTYVEVEIK